MRVRGKLRDVFVGEDMIVSFTIPKTEGLEKLQDKDLIIDVKQFREGRSLNANAYFWKLCDEIAKVLCSTKDDVYILQLSKYGTFVDVECVPDAIDQLERQFRYVEQFEEPFSDKVIARCYFGSSTYNTLEMSHLIDGTVRDAKDLGIDTWTQEEIDRALALWEG